MADIAALPKNGFKAVSTFSGCGGSSLGYKMAGFEVLWANEFIPAAQDTYRANHPDTLLDTRDIRQVTGQSILDALGMSVGELDLFDGSPPCASFSTAGKREDGWGKVKAYSDTKQRVDDLFFEYARLVKEVQPKVFVAENVSGLVKGTAKGYFLDILAALKACGYHVKARLLDAQWLGVPQMRQRVIFIGVRNDLALDPVFPTPLPYRYSVRDALPWIVKHGIHPPGTYTPQFVDSAARPADALLTSVSSGSGLVHAYVEPESSMEGYAVRAACPTLREGESTYYGGRLWKPSIEKPSPTVTQIGGNPGAASVAHPTEKRKFSIAELKRICAFPDDFILTGSYAQQWERLGRAVPPVMMSWIAKTVRDEILAKCAE